MLTALRSTGQRIRELTRARNEAELGRRPAQESWSVLEIMAHLRSCADVWGGHIARMLSEDKPTIRYVSPRTWIRKTDYLQQPFENSLHQFSTQRSELLKTLGGVSLADWSRGAILTGKTRGNRPTVFDHAHLLVDHEQVHCEQIAEALGSTPVGRA